MYKYEQQQQQKCCTPDLHTDSDRDGGGARVNTIWICVAFEMGQTITSCVHEAVMLSAHFSHRPFRSTAGSIKVQSNEFGALAGLDQM